MKKALEAVWAGQRSLGKAWHRILAALAVGLLTACGGGGDSNARFDAAAIAAANAVAPPVTPPTVVSPEAPPPTVPSEKKTRWATTWQSAMYANRLQNNDSDTVRVRIRTSVGGEGVRVRLSNVFGSTTLRVDHASVALPDASQPSDPTAIDPATRRVLTFDGGKTLAEVPAGEELLSDPVAMAVPKLSDLMISLHFQGKVQYADMHMNAAVPLPGFYVVRSRDVAAEASLSAVAPEYETYNGVFNLSEVKVLAPEATRVVVAVGESITAGYSAVGIQSPWPAVLSKLANGNGEPLGVGNAGISGNSMFNANNGPSLFDRFQRDVLSRDPTDIIILAGDNDLSKSSAADIIERYKYFIDLARFRKIRIHGGVNTPIGDIVGVDGNPVPTGYYTASNDAKWRQINDWIKTSGYFDGVIDFATVVGNPERTPLGIATACYDPRSPIHLNTRGLEVMGTLAYDVLYGKLVQPAEPCNALAFPPLPN
ncbi:GDSL-type esterase/lipase family protein [Variovorax sp. UC122_21]|uniref:GDSL-type esterase/lipase family protein n=1 Tax=Variovorax sp. UC122_21 TaxID=3374554 RepID=UPI00375695BE